MCCLYAWQVRHRYPCVPDSDDSRMIRRVWERVRYEMRRFALLAGVIFFLVGVEVLYLSRDKNPIVSAALITVIGSVLTVYITQRAVGQRETSGRLYVSRQLSYQRFLLGADKLNRQLVWDEDPGRESRELLGDAANEISSVVLLATSGTLAASRALYDFLHEWIGEKEIVRGPDCDAKRRLLAVNALIMRRNLYPRLRNDFLRSARAELGVPPQTEEEESSQSLRPAP